jgi:hypothetical protein
MFAVFQGVFYFQTNSTWSSACYNVLLQYLTEASDVQIWLNEKKQQLAKDDSPRDEKTADRLLTKHKVKTSPLKGKHFN